MEDNVMSDRSTASSSSVSGSNPTVESKSKNPKIRTNLTLDLNSLKPSSTSNNQLQVPATSGTTELKASPGFLLTSPDVQMLQLASPDLEKFLIQGLMGQNTPTPTQIVFPKTVTEEQESYAKGFVDALNALHRGGMSGMAYNVVSPQGQNVFPINQVGGQNFLPQIFTLPSNQFQLQPMQMQQIPTQQFQQNSHLALQQPKMEPYSPSVSPVPSDPQTVPSDRGSVKSSNSSSGTSPINMEDQSKMKMERKRERNRLAAAKCRQRKLERISELEEKVKGLKDQNSALADSANQLRNDLHALKQELLMHVSSGCSIEMSDNLMQTMHEMAQFQHS